MLLTVASAKRSRRLGHAIVSRRSIHFQNHSMSAAEKRKTPISLLVNNSVASSGGDVILPCATPVLKVIVALSSLFGASLTVAPSYIRSNKSTSGITSSSPAIALLEHGVEGVFKVNHIDLINSLALSLSFLLDEMHLLYLNAHATSLSASILPWF